MRPPAPEKLPVTRDLQGNVITVHNLPPPDTVRWNVNKKAIVVRAVEHRLISLEAVLARYRMTEGEFNAWKTGLASHGPTGLKSTKRQALRRSDYAKTKEKGPT